MRKIFIIILFLFYGADAIAGHITGGEMYYTYVGLVNGQHRYNVTLKFYKRCFVTTSFPNPAVVSVFNKTDNSRFADIDAPLVQLQNINLPINNPCISNPPLVCFDIAWYSFTISLPASVEGYILASQVNFRINGMNNLTPGYNAIGATFTTEIPGNVPIGTAMQNNSARFTGSDLVLVCTGNSFSYSFRATDPDGDELRYIFCEAYRSTAGGGTNGPTEPPPFVSIPYKTPGFSGSQPMGPGISVNSSTGLVEGVAPEAGQYVVTVCVEEIRNGLVIATQRKDIQINVADCSIASATLLPEYLLCGGTQTISLTNLTGGAAISNTEWEIRDRTGTVIHTYNGAGLEYNFSDTGLYTVKLVINRNLTCADSTTSIIRVYPGFVPYFSYTGGCLNGLTSFTDLTSSVYGTVNTWNWDFGEASTTLDISALQNPDYRYPQTGLKTVRLIASDNRGCRDTVEKTINITIGPPLSVAFSDTLICINDDLILQAIGQGNFSWSPAISISDPSSPTPQVTPPVTTTYYVSLEDGGCSNRDSVRVRVVNFVTLQTADTTICSGDNTQLQIISDGLQYTWSPAAAVSNPFIKNPFTSPAASTTLTVTAVVGGCSATDSFTITPVPYPVANAGADITVCYKGSGQLNGFTDGSSWNWSPAQYLDNPSNLSPMVAPPRTAAFVLAAYDTRGCPKPGLDTVLVIVRPKMNVSAGNDTAVIVGQPLQLNATGGATYTWSPAFRLSAIDIANPVALFNSPSTGLQYQVTAVDTAGCSESAYITIKVFQTGPTVFVPSAFTPNNDGRNDLLRPLGAGIKYIETFSVYNRWGQLLFTTRNNGQGWDGRFNGVMQATGTYVWFVKAVDFNNRPYFQKGVFTLIR